MLTQTKTSFPRPVYRVDTNIWKVENEEVEEKVRKLEEIKTGGS